VSFFIIRLLFQNIKSILFPQGTVYFYHFEEIVSNNYLYLLFLCLQAGHHKAFIDKLKIFPGSGNYIATSNHELHIGVEA
jgi:hypothetical protein